MKFMSTKLLQDFEILACQDRLTPTTVTACAK